MNRDLLYNQLLERKKAGEKLDIKDLTTEEWKQLCLHEKKTPYFLTELFDNSEDSIIGYRKRKLGRVIKDYLSIDHLYRQILEDTICFYIYDYSVEILEVINAAGYKEAYYTDPKEPTKYKMLFKVDEELDRQKKIRENNKAGKSHIDTLMDKLFDMLYEFIEKGFDKEYDFNYYILDYDIKKEEFIRLYKKRDKRKVKIYSEYKEISTPKIPQVTQFKTTKPHVTQKRTKTKPIKQDYQKINEAKIEVGNIGQEIVYEHESFVLADHPDLVNKIEKTYEIDDSAGYDIKSFDEFGNTIYIEVKTNSSNNSDKRIKFNISSNEDEFITTQANAYIYYVYNLADPRIKKINQEQYIQMYKTISEYLIDVDCE